MPRANPKRLVCFSYAANCDGLGRFLLANGIAFSGDEATITENNTHTVPFAGKIVRFCHDTGAGDATTVFRVHVNAGTTDVTLAAADGVVSVDIDVVPGDKVAIEADAGTLSAGTIIDLILELPL